MASWEERPVSTEGNSADSNLSVVGRHGDHGRKEKTTVSYSQLLKLPPELMEQFDAGELPAAS